MHRLQTFDHLKCIRVFFFSAGTLFSFITCGQQNFLNLNREMNISIERQLNDQNNFSHTGFKPYLESKINPGSLEMADSTHLRKKEYTHFLARKLKSESLIIIDSGEFHLTIDPLFNFSYGTDFTDTSLRADTTVFYTNTRGVLVRADFGKKISVTSSFLENQSFFPAYIDAFVKANKVVPGSGRVKPFKTNGYDYAMASGYVSFSPFKNLNIQAGHDKNFIGDGYRSLLLSDNSFNYPFLKITSCFFNNRIQYTNLYAQLSTLERLPASSTPEALFKPGAGTFHYLSIIPWKRLHIGLFEGITWERWDSTGTRPFDWNFVNPVIFVNSGIYGLNGKNNAVAGLNLKLKLLKGLFLYSQFVLDDHENNAIGYQAGLRSFDLFTIKNLNVQAEFGDYVHYNQYLAHPFGDDFTELVSIVDYRWKDFFFQGKINYAYNSDGFPSGKNYSMDTITTLLFQDARIGYIINRVTNMNLYLGFINRNQLPFYPGAPAWNTQLLYFGFRTSVSNQYFDF
jgi:hypothetical protein